MHFPGYSLFIPLVLAFPFADAIPPRNDLGLTKHPRSTAYFLDNNPSGSSVISLSINRNGILSNPHRTSTSGYGSIGTNAAGLPLAADSLFSQGSVAVAGDLLFTVNAGSNTVVMFRIDAANPSRLSIVGSPVDTLGDFPVSVTYSEKFNTACVLNGGSKAGVTCFHADPFRGLMALGSIRSLSIVLNQTTPPHGPPNTASQIIFSPDSSALLAMIKGSAGVTPRKPGSIIAWAVEGGNVSQKPVVTRFADVAMEFGTVFLSNSRLLVSDPSYGVSVLEVASDLTLVEEVHTVIANESAVCWATYDPELDTVYAIDAGLNKIYVLDPATGAQTGTISVASSGSSTSTGLFDSAVKNEFLYSLAVTAGIVVTNSARGEQVQYFDLTSVGSRQGFIGMAVYP